MVQADKDEARALSAAIDGWLQSGIITSDQAAAMRATIVPKTSERQQLAQYFFIIAVSSALLAFGALFLDEKLLEHLRRTFLLSNYTIALAAAALAAGTFWYAGRKRPHLSTTGYEVWLIPAALTTLVSLVYLCKELGNGAGYTFFTGLMTVTFFALSIVFRSRVLWVCALAAVMGWFGAFSTVHSQGNLFLGMNYPVRFTIFGLCILGLSYLQLYTQRLRGLQPITYQAALLIFYTGLWGVSVFGNFATLDEWHAVRQARMLPYAFASGAITALGLFAGIRRRDEVLRDYSILFLLLSLYTRYFEYFWDGLNKGLFFLVLAVSFGLLARWLSQARNPATSE